MNNQLYAYKPTHGIFTPQQHQIVDFRTQQSLASDYNALVEGRRIVREDVDRMKKQFDAEVKKAALTVVGITIGQIILVAMKHVAVKKVTG